MLTKLDIKDFNYGVVPSVSFKTLGSGESLAGCSSKSNEIVIYIVNGKLDFKDSIGDVYSLGRGEVLKVTSGSNIEYSISNNQDSALKFIEYTIAPDHDNLDPSTEAHKYKWKLRINQWLEVVSHIYGEAQVRVNQDVRVDVIMLDNNLTEGFAVDSDKVAHLIQLEGTSEINGKNLKAMDSLLIDGEDIMITATDNSHIIALTQNK